ncbi:SoxR reducing system RseC family protein [Granulosicoccus sp. 3-233]|uniref:SoxR reducing system RseC family protein n=1 Tax=Granulosicoccus sp. 3-233 TaxID=3417969 RepID=UPI003D32C32F
MRRSGLALDSVEAGELASVQIHAPSQCMRCARGQGCGAGIFNQGVAAVQLSCLSERAVEAGDEVLVEFEGAENANWLRLVLGAYGLPTGGLLLAIVTSSLALERALPAASLSLAQQDLLLAIAGLTGLAGGVFAWRMLAPGMLRRSDAGHCLRSGRIVAVSHESSVRISTQRPLPPVREETR